MGMSDNNTKKCGKCGLKKPKSAFYRTSGATCKECQRKQVNALRAARASLSAIVSADLDSTKLCSYCKQFKPLQEFGIAKHQPDGRNHRCKQCRNSLKAEKLRRAKPIGKRTTP